MPRCTLEREVEADHVVIRVFGTFDRDGAQELRARLAGEPGDVVLDFSLVEAFEDLGIATLVLGISQRARRPVLHGLRTHQLRIFRYFGMDLDAFPSEAGADAR